MNAFTAPSQIKWSEQKQAKISRDPNFTPKGGITIATSESPLSRHVNNALRSTQIERLERAKKPWQR